MQASIVDFVTLLTRWRIATGREHEREEHGHGTAVCSVQTNRQRVPLADELAVVARPSEKVRPPSRSWAPVIFTSLVRGPARRQWRRGAQFCDNGPMNHRSVIATKVAAKTATTNAARAQFLGIAFAVTFLLGAMGDALGMGSLANHGFMLAQMLGSLAVVAIVRFSKRGARHAGVVFAFGMSAVSASGALHLAQFGGLDGPYFYGCYTAPPVFIPILLSLSVRVAATLAAVGGFVVLYWLRVPDLFAHPMAHIPATYLLTISGISISLGEYVRRLEEAGFHDVARLEIAADALEERLRVRAGGPAHLRHEIARQLHDDVAQLITGARIHFDGWSRKRGADELGTHLGKLLDELARRTHRMLDDLREPPPTGPLLQALERLRAEYASLGLTVEVLLDDAESNDELAIHQAEVVVATAREALTNSLRHGRSSEATVSVRLGSSQVFLDVLDNGGGRSADVREGYGLRGIRERVEGLGGTATLRDYEEGLRLSLSFPRMEGA